MSTINSSSLTVYDPTSSANSYIGSMWQDSSSSSGTDSASDSTSSSVTTSASSSSAVSQSPSASSMDYSDILKQNPLLSTNVVGYKIQQNLLKDLGSSTETDSMAALSSELDQLNSGISPSEASSVASLLSKNSSSDIAYLGAELNQVNALSAAAATTKGNTPVLNYNYSSSDGITTNNTPDVSKTGSNVDVSV